MDKHLNLYKFFNNGSYEYYEDNLSRAFALCLQNNTLLLSNILRAIFDDEIYDNVFSIDYPNYNIDIDLQVRLSTLENYSMIYGVSCSGLSIDKELIEKTNARETENPETDLFIGINDICILFEFKRTNEDCSAQLKRQVEIVKQNCSEDVQIQYRNLNWNKIISICLSVFSIEKQIKKKNIFLADFIAFIEYDHPEWFPERLLSNIPFPHSTDIFNDPNEYYLSTRLNQIKKHVFTEDKTVWISDRCIITLDKDWCKELHVNYSTDNNAIESITIELYPGDTKGQGYSFYKKDDSVYNWEKLRIKDYRIEVKHYLKFSHFNSGITWLDLNDHEYKITHKYSFFSEWSGRYHRDDWNSNFCDPLTEIIPNWKERCDWEYAINSTNRNYFDLSIGTHIIVYIPYRTAQKMDNKKDLYLLSNEIRNVFEEISKEIDA